LRRNNFADTMCVDCVKLDAKNEEYLYLVRTTPDDEEMTYILMLYTVPEAVPTAVLPY
jgi:hypothetical protein